MPRIAYVILCSCLIVFAGLVASSANAGSRDDGYYVDVAHPPHRPKRIWYSSSCCYMKIVRHVGGERQVRYVKVKPPRVEKASVQGHRHHAARRDRVRPREQISRKDSSRRHAEYKVIVVHRGRDRDRDRERCRGERVRVLAAGGGWVWAVKARCY
jgi:hypothetical protein